MSGYRKVGGFASRKRKRKRKRRRDGETDG
jgi:hypothetical protein